MARLPDLVARIRIDTTDLRNVGTRASASMRDASDQATNALRDLPDRIGEIGNRSGENLGNGIRNGVEDITDRARADFDRIGQDLGNSIGNGVRGGVDEAGGNIGNGIRDSVRSAAQDAVRDFRREFGRAGREAGEDAGDGLEGGLRRGSDGYLRDARGRFASGSRQIGDESGENIGRGLLGRLKSYLGGIKPIRIPIFLSAAGDVLGAAIAPLLGILTAVGLGAFAMGAQVASAAASLLALAAAAARSVGVLAALPTFLGAFQLASKTFQLAGSGVKAALTELGSSSGGAASAVKNNAQAISSALRGVTQAQKSVEDATKNVTKSYREVATAQRQEIAAARSVAQAQDSIAEAYQNLADAQVRVRKATQSLSDAYEDAEKNLASYTRRLQGAAADEESADLARQEAQRNLEKLIKGGEDDSLELAKARNDVVQSELAYQQAVEDNLDLQKEATKATKAGVDGDQDVISTREELDDANRNVTSSNTELNDSYYDLAQAQQGVIDAQQATVDAQDGVAEAAYRLKEAQLDLIDAQQRVTDAQEDFAAGAGGAASAFDKLSPAAKQFVTELRAMQPRLDQLRATAAAGLFPGVIEGLKGLMPLFPALDKSVGQTAGIFGRLASETGVLIGGPLGPEFTRILENSVGVLRTLATAVNPLVTAFIRASDAAGPLALILAGDLARGLTNVANNLSAVVGDGRFVAFLDRAYESAKLLGSILSNLGIGLFSFFSAGADVGREMLVSIDAATERFRAFTASTEGQNSIRTFFENARESARIFTDTIGNVAVSIFNIASAARPAGIELATAFQQATQRLQEFTGSAEGQEKIKRIFLDIVPVVKEVGLLLVDVVKGLVTFATLPGNAGLVKQLREELLPAVIQLFKSLSETGILEKAITFITQFVTTLQSLAGVTQAASGIIDVLSIALGVLQTALAIPGVTEILKLATYLAGAAAAAKLIIGLGAGLIQFLGPLFSVFSSIAGAVGRFIPILLRIAPVALQVGRVLLAALTGPIGIIIAIVTVLAIVIYKNWASIENATIVAFEAVKGAVLSAFSSVRDFVVGVVGGIASFVSGVWYFLAGSTASAFNGARDFIVGAFTTVRDFLVSVVTGIKNFVVDKFIAIREGISNAIGGAQDFFGGAVEGIRSKAVEVFDKVRTAVSEKLGAVVDLITSLPGLIKDKLVNIGTSLFETGKNLIQGLLDGAGSLLGKIGTFFLDKVPSFIKEPFKKALGIASPSKVFADYGKNVGQGFINGVSTTTGAVASAVKGLANISTGSFKVAAPSVSTGSVMATARGGYASGGTQTGGGVTFNQTIQAVPFTPAQVQTESVNALLAMERRYGRYA